MTFRSFKWKHKKKDDFYLKKIIIIIKRESQKPTFKLPGMVRLDYRRKT